MSFDFNSFSHLMNSFNRLNISLRVEGNELVIRPGGRLMPRAKTFFVENKLAIIAVLRLRHHFEQSAAVGHPAGRQAQLNRLHREAERLCGCTLLKSGYPMRVGYRQAYPAAIYSSLEGIAERTDIARRIAASQAPLGEEESNHSEPLTESVLLESGAN